MDGARRATMFVKVDHDGAHKIFSKRCSKDCNSYQVRKENEAEETVTPPAATVGCTK